MLQEPASQSEPSEATRFGSVWWAESYRTQAAIQALTLRLLEGPLQLISLT